jgi:20S proteasome alpha/beta subunit
MPEVRIIIPEDLDRALDALIKAGFAGNKAELARTAITHFLSTIPTQLPKGYDLETAFSPDGHVFQLEYAYESMKRGGTIVGVWCDDGVALAKELPKEDAFMVFPNPFVQTFKIGESIGTVYCGILTDGYFLVEEARKIGATDVEALVQKLALFMQPYSQRKDVRPLAAALIIGGLDSEKRPRLFLLNSSGLAQEYKACHVGVGCDETKEILKSGYRPKLKLEEAVALAARAALRETRKPENVLLATIEAKTKRFREISLGEKERMWKTVFP